MVSKIICVTHVASFDAIFDGFCTRTQPNALAPLSRLLLRKGCGGVWYQLVRVGWFDPLGWVQSGWVCGSLSKSTSVYIGNDTEDGHDHDHDR